MTPDEGIGGPWMIPADAGPAFVQRWSMGWIREAVASRNLDGETFVIGEPNVFDDNPNIVRGEE